MSLRIQSQGTDVDASATLKPANAANGTSSTAQQAKSKIDALYAAQDTTSISDATSQLSGDVAIRQDRVDALRSQIESGTYSVNANAVASAMFQNLFRS